MSSRSLPVPEGAVLVGVVVGAHGIKGELNVKTFTEAPESLAAYGPVALSDGRRFTVTRLKRAKGDIVIVNLEGVADRDAAEALKGQRLFVPRTALPEPEDDEIYHVDLVGLAVEDESGKALGSVRGVHNFGAGDVMEVEDEKGDVSFLPFTKAVVPVVDLAQKRVVVRPPGEVE